MTDRYDHTTNLPAPHAGTGELAPPVSGYYYPPGPDYYGSDEGLDWQRISALLWAKKWWILGLTAVFAVGAYFATRYFIQPTYTAQASVWFDETETRSRGPIESEDVLGGEGWADLLRSRAVLTPVVQAEGLQVEPLEPRENGRALFQGLEADVRPVSGRYTVYAQPDGTYRLVHEERGLVETGRVGDVIGETAGFRWSPDADQLRPGSAIQFRLSSVLAAALDLRGRLKSQYDSRSSLIVAELSWDDREEAAEILNAVMEGFVETATALKNRKLEEVVGILEQQTTYAADELREKELALESFRVQTITEPTEPEVSIPGGQTTRGSVFGTYFEQRLTARQFEIEVQQIDEILNGVRSGDSLHLLALQQIPSAARDPALSQTLENLYEYEADRRALLFTYTEEHPAVVEKDQQIATLRRQTIPSQLSALRTQLQQRKNMLEGQMTAQARELRQIPPRTIEETRRAREFGLAEDLHNKLLGRLREAQLAAATSLPDMQVVDEAIPPLSPDRDQSSRYIIMASMAGMGLGLAGALLFDRLDSRIRYPTQITNNLGLPVLGIVPRLTDGGNKDGTLATITIEAFRSIRTQIAHAHTEDNRVVLITSPAPRDGKSMVAANLAISYASSGHRALLIDADTRRGRAQDMFDLPKTPGLTDYLARRASREDIVQTTQVQGLDLIARGDPREFNPELLSSKRMGELIERVRADYDIVVLDAPPLAAGADPLLLGEYSDKVVLVLRAGATDEDMARAKLDLVGNVELPFVGAVLNAVPETAPYYDYYANYYYVEAAAG